MSLTPLVYATFLNSVKEWLKFIVVFCIVTCEKNNAIDNLMSRSDVFDIAEGLDFHPGTSANGNNRGLLFFMASTANHWLPALTVLCIFLDPSLICIQKFAYWSSTFFMPKSRTYPGKSAILASKVACDGTEAGNYVDKAYDLT